MTSSQRKMAAAEGGLSDNKNTLKKTKFDLRIVQSFLSRAREERPLLAVPVAELDEHLATFIRTHRKPDGSEYEAGTLRGILGSLDRHFERSGYPHAIYRSKETKFQKTVGAMRERQSYLKTLSRGPQPGHQSEPLSERDIERLYATGAIGLHSPTALLHMLFFNVGLHFSLRTLEQHGLRWGDIALKSDPQGRKYLEHTKRLSAGRGRLHPGHTMRMQIYESPEQPDRDVVKAYEKYAQERPDKMKARDSPFYLTPQPDHRPGYARWFKNLPVGEARIRGIMKHLKMAAGLSPQPKIVGADSETVNGCRSNGHTVKKDDEEPPYTDPNRCSPAIKEEWEEPAELSEHEKSLIPGRGVVTFHDVAAYFSAKEWLRLEEWQKELYKNVMREIHAALEGMGYKIINGDVLLKIRDEEHENMSPEPEQSQDSRIAPDILLRIRHDGGAHEHLEEEHETSSPGIPGFDPDLSLWNLKEDIFSPEDGKEQTPHADSDADIISLSQPTFASNREPIPGISTLCVTTRPRPGKRKRRPPQRRSYEQTADSEDDHLNEDDHKQRLPGRNLSPKERGDWMPREKILQCDLCERTFSKRSNVLETHQSCPQCGGTLSPLHGTNSFLQTTTTHPVADTNPSFSCRLQGPVG